jgi:hypothetical protein
MASVSRQEIHLSHSSGKGISIPFGSKSPGTTLGLCTDNNQASQRWNFNLTIPPSH